MNNKILLITGANSGIGYAATTNFLKKGFKVIALDKNVNKLKTLLNENLVVIQIDLINNLEIENLFKMFKEKKIYPSALINAAGIREIVPVVDLSVEDFRKVIEVNLIAPFVLSKEIIKIWINLNIKGSIINIASVSGLIAEPERAAYVSSKHAILGLTKQLSVEFGKSMIRVNSISPGVIRTELTEEYFENEDIKKTILNNQSLDFFGSPSNIVSCINYLLSDEANFITGSNFVIDGGWTSGKKL